MKIVTYSHARNALKSVLDEVVRDADVTVISRRDTWGDAVVMSLDHYNSLIETLHLLSTPANAEAMACAIRQDHAGSTSPSRRVFNGKTPSKSELAQTVKGAMLKQGRSLVDALKGAVN